MTCRLGSRRYGGFGNLRYDLVTGPAAHRSAPGDFTYSSFKFVVLSPLPFR